MCRCGKRACALCQAKWVAPAAAAAHRHGAATLAIPVEVADPTLQYDGKRVVSLLHPHLQAALKHGVDVATLPPGVGASLVRVARQLELDLVFDDGRLQRRPVDALVLLRAAGHGGVDLAANPGCHRGMRALLDAGRAWRLPGTEIVFDRDVARAKTGEGVVFAAIYQLVNPNR